MCVRNMYTAPNARIEIFGKKIRKRGARQPLLFKYIADHRSFPHKKYHLYQFVLVGLLPTFKSAYPWMCVVQSKVFQRCNKLRKR